LEFDEEEEVGGSGCGGLAFMACPLGSKKEWERMGVELFKEEKITEREKETVAGLWVEDSVLRRECYVLSFWRLDYFYS
jgi:hypothetical protein